MLTIKIDGLDAVRAKLQSFSDRRFNAALATALTRTARAIDVEWKEQLATRLDRPKSVTTGSVVVDRATAVKLSADILIKDRAGTSGRAPAEWLITEQTGGTRYVKKFERALMSQGSLPSGWSVVPGPAAKLDSFGNVTRGQIVQVIAQLGAQYSPGYQRVISKSADKRAKKALASGQQYVAVLPYKLAGKKEGRRPGVYVRTADGFPPVFLFVRRVAYRPRLSLLERGRAIAEQQLGPEVRRAVAESLARQQAQGALT